MPKIPGLDVSGHSVGEIIDLGHSILPFGALLCDGSAVSRTTYAALFAKLGVTWGPGDGSTTFNLPPSEGLTTVGAGTYTDVTLGSITRTLGQIMGEAAHTLVVGEMPAHQHGYGMQQNSAAGTDPNAMCDDTSGTFTDPYGTVDSTGGGAYHNNMQPSMVTTKAIFYI